MELEELSEKVNGCAIQVHRSLGPGFLESVYEKALVIELRKSGLAVRQQEEIPILYDGQEIGRHRLDLLVEDQLLIELKAVRALEKVHFATARSYLKALHRRHGIIYNFNSVPLTIKRVIYDPDRFRKQR